MEKKQFEGAELQVILFDGNDVITTSVKEIPGDEDSRDEE